MPQRDLESRSPKSRRINLRVTDRHEAVLRRAAEATDSTLTDFVLGIAVEHAERVLTDRRWFTASEGQFEAFLQVLDAPLPPTNKFSKMFARASRFEEPE